jgi:PAS domain-containing protein
VTTPHDDYATKSVLHSDKTIFTDAQQAEARVSAWLAGASGSFAREDIELLLNELGRRQTTIEAQERELHRVQSALLASEEQLSLAQEKAKSVSWGWSPETSPFKALIENIDGSIWSIDTNYRLTVSNSTYRQDVARAFGREIAAGDFLLAWDDYPLAGETFRIEAQRSSTDHKWMEYRFNPIRTSTGQIAGVTVFGSDVTERKHAEAMIQEQLAEITNYYDNAPVGLAVFDKELRYRRINHLLADANGFSVQEHLGKTVEEILPDLGEEMRRLTGQILATGEPVMGVEFSRASKREPSGRKSRCGAANTALWKPSASVIPGVGNMISPPKPQPGQRICSASLTSTRWSRTKRRSRMISRS